MNNYITMERYAMIVSAMFMASFILLVNDDVTSCTMVVQAINIINAVVITYVGMIGNRFARAWRWFATSIMLYAIGSIVESFLPTLDVHDKLFILTNVTMIGGMIIYLRILGVDRPGTIAFMTIATSFVAYVGIKSADYNICDVSYITTDIFSIIAILMIVLGNYAKLNQQIVTMLTAFIILLIADQTKIFNNVIMISQTWTHLMTSVGLAFITTATMVKNELVITSRPNAATIYVRAIIPYVIIISAIIACSFNHLAPIGMIMLFIVATFAIHEAMTINKDNVRADDVDPLTLLHGTMGFNAALATYGRCAVILIDVNGIRRINDELGRSSGDQALQRISTIIRRSSDAAGGVAARLTGEEFALALPEVSYSSTTAIANEIRLAVANDPTLTELAVTVTIGASADDAAESAKKLAREALLEARNVGKGTVRVK